MRNTASFLRLFLCLGLSSACATARMGVEDARPEPIKVGRLSGGKVQLSFPQVMPSPELEVMSVEEAQAALMVFHASFLAGRPEIRVVSPTRLHLLGDIEPAGAERQLREGFQARFGSMLVPLPDPLEQSRLFRALKLSPQYMSAGAREAARELFSSPVFVASVCLSVGLYFAAWLVPEPLFSKAFAVTLTAALAITVGMLEVVNLALACLRLYRESNAARTEEELEAAAEHFGKATGGTMLRVLVMVASMGIAKTMPTLPPGGLGALLGAPRYAMQSGLALETAATAQVIADGSLVLDGVVMGEAATRLCGGLAVCSTMERTPGQVQQGSKPSTRYGPPHTRQNPQHNEAIEEELEARESAGDTELRKNKAQLDAEGKRVFDREPVDGIRYRKPDASSLRPDGVRHNTNYVSNARDLKRELEAFEAMRRADSKAIHELYLLDGTLVRRYVPPGVSYP